MTKFTASLENDADENSLRNLMHENNINIIDNNANKLEDIVDSTAQALKTVEVINRIQGVDNLEEKVNISLEYLHNLIGLNDSYSLEHFDQPRFNRAFNIAAEGIIGRMIENYRLNKKSVMEITEDFEKIVEEGIPEFEGKKKIKEPGWGEIFTIIGHSLVSENDVLNLISEYYKIQTTGIVYEANVILHNASKEVLKIISSNQDEEKKVEALRKNRTEIYKPMDKIVDFVSKQTKKINKNYPDFTSASNSFCLKISKKCIDSRNNEKTTNLIRGYFDNLDMIYSSYYTLLNRYGSHNDLVKAVADNYIALVNVNNKLDPYYSMLIKILYGCLRYVQTSIKLG